MRVGRAALGLALGLVVRAWVWTLRVEVVGMEHARAVAGPWVLAFLHGRQLPLLRFPRRGPTGVLVSLSADGSMQAVALARLGLRIFRGSSSRGGARGLAALVRAMKEGVLDAAFAIDGPRGPYGHAKPGVVFAARRSGGHVIPLGAAATPAWTLSRAWDRFLIPWPFARVVIRVGRPLDADPTLTAADVAAAVAIEVQAAESLLSRPRAAPG